MNERTIPAPACCEECLFFEQNPDYHGCKLYPNHWKPYWRKSRSKYNFCRLHEIIIYEHDEHTSKEGNNESH